MTKSLSENLRADSSRRFALAGAAGIMIEDQTWPKRKFLKYMLLIVEESL